MKAATENKHLKAAGRRLPDYPFRWQGLEDFAYPLDEQGVPRVNMGKRLGLRYNPITIAQYGLFNLQQFSAAQNQSCLQRAHACAGWLIDNFKEWRPGIGAWIYDYDLNFYGPAAPWISGMAQAQGISLLLRVHQLNATERVPEITHQAFQAFLRPTAEGGVVSHFSDGSLIFEEFPTDPPSHVLNGHIFALLGIHDYAAYWQKEAALELFDVAVVGLERNLNLYDTGCWNLYDLHPSRRLASPMYVKVHIQLLRLLADLTSDVLFAETSEKWSAYLRDPICRARWLFGKILEKIRLRF